MQHVSRTLVLCTLLGAMLAPHGAEAQGGILGRARERAKQKIEERVGERTDQAADAAVNRVENAVICAVTDRKCVEKAQREGKTAVDPDGNPIQGGASSGGASASAGARPGEGAWANYDFVPGERVLFAEDFSRDRVGNFPQRLELIQGTAEVVDWRGRRWLRMQDYTAFKVPLPERLPERFTVEFEVTVPWSRMGFYSEENLEINEWSQYVPDHYATSAVVLSGTEVGVHRGGSSGSSAVDPRNLFTGLYGEDNDGADLLTRPIKVRMQVDGKYIKLYMDEKRVANMPNGNFGRADFLLFEFDDNGNDAASPLITGFSINVGGQRMYDALMADGRVSTQGILFDTGSDRIRPESTPTLVEITAMLKQHADLRLMIEGHTDSVGQPAANRTLSEKRAAAVRQYLVGQGIDASRLQSAGLGDTKPKATNDTPEGRQQNRRVELVKL